MTERPASAGWPWPGADFFQSLFPSLAPTSLNQPIQPGWIFANAVTVDQSNSSAPEVERAIVAKESYGRQLGCVIAALNGLIEARPAAERTREMKDLLELAARIEKIKRESVEQRLENVESWLADLKARDAETYRTVTKRLRASLEAPE